MGLLALLKMAYVRTKRVLLFRLRMMVAGQICGWTRLKFKSRVLMGGGGGGGGVQRVAKVLYFFEGFAFP